MLYEPYKMDIYWIITENPCGSEISRHSDIRAK